MKLAENLNLKLLRMEQENN